MPGDGDGDGTTPSFIIHHRQNSRNSIRSALRSPELFDPAGFGVAEEDEEYNDDNDDDDDGVKEGEKEDDEAAVVSQGEGIYSEEPEEIIEAKQQQQEQQEEKGIHAVRGEEVSEATKLMAEEKGKGKPSKK